MYKAVISYTDFLGVDRTEEFCFNLTQAEIVEMENSKDAGLKSTLEKIIKKQDRKGLIKYFKKIILDSYGVISEDGRRFIKNETLREEFSQTAAYSKLFMKLSSDDIAANEFVKGILPKTKKNDQDRDTVLKEFKDLNYVTTSDQTLVTKEFKDPSYVTRSDRTSDVY